MNKLVNLLGMKFGRLTVVERAENRKGRTFWKCECECGKSKEVAAYKLKIGEARSCGCRQGGLKDLTGQTIDDWYVIERAATIKKTTYWLCRCVCGVEKPVGATDLTYHRVVSCGCRKRKKLIGQKFGKLTVVGFSDTPKKDVYWNCLCDCGEKKEVRNFELVSGKVTSCDCDKENRTYQHGMSHTPEYTIWVGIKQRCGNPNGGGYKNYGGRGIKVCERWNKFENFYSDMGPRPSDKHSIDRIDNDGNYCPNNCKWATSHEQCCNKRTNNRTIGVYKIPDVQLGKPWRWQTTKNKVKYSGTCKTSGEAAKAYDDKCEELGRGRPNGT